MSLHILKAALTSGLCSLTDTFYFISGFDDIKKLQFQIHASPDHFSENSCTPPKKANLVSSQRDFMNPTGRRCRNGCTPKYQLP